MERLRSRPTKTKITFPDVKYPPSRRLENASIMPLMTTKSVLAYHAAAAQSERKKNHKFCVMSIFNLSSILPKKDLTNPAVVIRLSVSETRPRCTTWYG